MCILLLNAMYDVGQPDMLSMSCVNHALAAVCFGKGSKRCDFNAYHGDLLVVQPCLNTIGHMCKPGHLYNRLQHTGILMWTASTHIPSSLEMLQHIRTAPVKNLQFGVRKPKQCFSQVYQCIASMHTFFRSALPYTPIVYPLQFA